MATVDFHGKAYEVRTAPDPRLRCSLCAVRGCRGAAPCMDLPVGSYLWTEPERRPDPPRLTVPVPGAGRPAPLPAPEEKRGGRGGGRLKPLPEGLAQRVAEAGRAGERADVVARREGISLALVYKTWRLEGVYEVRGKRPAQKSLGDLQVGNGRRRHMGGTGKPGRPVGPGKVYTERIAQLLAKEPDLSNKAVGRRLGISAAYVGRLRKKAGLSRPRRGRVRGADIKYNTAAQQYIIGHNDEGNQVIAEALGVAPSTIGRWRKELGLPRKTRAECRAMAWAARRKIGEKEREYIREHAGKVSDRVIAEALGVDRKLVCDHRRALGIVPCHRSGRVTDETRAIVEANPGLSLKDLAALTGLHPNTVWALRKKYGLPPLRRGAKRKKEEGNAEEGSGTGI